MMQSADLFTNVERQIAVAEQQFEDIKAQLFEGELSRDQFARRRAYAREIEAWLGDLHETRRKVAPDASGEMPRPRPRPISSFAVR